MKCIFNESVNSCPFLVRNNSQCNNPNRCSFQEILVEQPIKKEKWFEQYYKKK